MSSFDFVIIGGGTSRLVLANRLSEDSGQRILILEAGSDHSDDPRVNTPALFLSLLKSEAGWGFESTPQTNLKGRSVGLQQGLSLGRSSAINAHVFAPPSKGLIDVWGSLGNEGQWHPCGSCPMLPIDKGGVVDTRLRVYGTRNLRAVDAGAIPLISIANLQATVYAFAERAADLTKEDYGLR